MEEKTLGQIARAAFAWANGPTTEDDWEKAAKSVVLAHDARRWKAIESAPKDRPVILTGPLQDGGEYQDVCKWYESKVAGKGGCWPVIFMHGFGAPTHWAECLPAPPKEASNAE